jgi:hypothetical protein
MLIWTQSRMMEYEAAQTVSCLCPFIPCSRLVRTLLHAAYRTAALCPTISDCCTSKLCYRLHQAPRVVYCNLWRGNSALKWVMRPRRGCRQRYEIRRVLRTEAPHDAATKTVSVRARPDQREIPTGFREPKQKYRRASSWRAMLQRPLFTPSVNRALTIGYSQRSAYARPVQNAAAGFAGAPRRFLSRSCWAHALSTTLTGRA